jgi:hypothetical protein
MVVIGESNPGQGLNFLTIVPQHNATEGDRAKAKAKAKKATKTKSSGKAKSVRVVAKRATESKLTRAKMTSEVVSWDQFVEKVRPEDRFSRAGIVPPLR